jgi:hypothetical protein
MATLNDGSNEDSADLKNRHSSSKTPTSGDKKLATRQVKFQENKSDDNDIELDDDQKQKVSTVEMCRMVDARFTEEYPDKALYAVFVLLFLCSLLVNVDHGTLPGCSEAVKAKLNI